MARRVRVKRYAREGRPNARPIDTSEPEGTDNSVRPVTATNRRVVHVAGPRDDRRDPGVAVAGGRVESGGFGPRAARTG